MKQVFIERTIPIKCDFCPYSFLDAHVSLLEQITKLQTENNLLKHEFATVKKLLDEGIKKNWSVKHVLDAYRAAQSEVN